MTNNIYPNQVNGPLPVRAQYGGWSTSVGLHDQRTSMTEAEAFKLLGEAIEHHEMMGKAIETLRGALGVKR